MGFIHSLKTILRITLDSNSVNVYNSHRNSARKLWYKCYMLQIKCTRDNDFLNKFLSYGRVAG